MDHFQSVCKNKLVKWYNENENTEIDLSNVFIVWSCKTLQNYKCLASTTVSGDGVYAEYTYNGDKQELYQDIYKKAENACIMDCHYVEHGGTLEDPIPAVASMEYIKGKYYIEDGTIYLMNRQGMAEGESIVLHYTPSQLVGIYFEVVQ